jgi:hypothetical protein
MSLSKSRLFAVGVVTAGLGAAALLVNAVPQLRSGLSLGVPGALGETAPVEKPPARAADKPADASQPKDAVRVEAPHTQVNVDKERGKVSVKAPHTDVRVDPEKRRVQVRAPYVDLDIRW